MVQAFVEERSQLAVGSWPTQGPDTYIAVQVVPDGVEKLNHLNRRVAKKRGIVIHYIGEGYTKNRGSRSALGQAIEKAEKLVESINNTKGT